MHFTVNIALWAVFMICRSTAEEASWSWADDKNQGAMNINEQFDQDLHPEGSENKESIVNLNDTQIGQIIDEILDSGRQGRSLDGFDEVYADPNVQNALQKGDDGEARNIIKDRLCYLGLMQCEEDIEGKRPFIAPEDLQYAQPVAINPIGRPIPTIPIRGPKRGTYGPPRPVHVPQNGGKYPPPNFAPPNRFGPNLNTNPNKPPRRGYGAPSKPFYGNKPPSPVYNGDYSPVEDIPYAFEIGSQSSHSESHFQSSLQKDKIFPGDKAGSKSDSFGAPVQHVHHHYHHDSENSDKTPTVIVKPVPVPVPVSSSSNSYESFNTNSGTHLAFKPSVQIGGSGLNSGLYGSQSSGGLTIGGSGLNSGSYGGQSSGGLTIGGSGFSSGSYGGQTLASYGGASGNNGIVKPVSENFGGQNYGSNQYGSSNYGSSFGQYSTNDFYKKELNLNGNSLTTNYLQGAHSDNYNNQFGNSDDCVCVPINQCQNHDVIGRKDDLYLAIDPRNIKSDIQAEEERVITDANGTMTVVTVPVGSNLNITELSADKKNTEEVKKISKREAPIYNSTVNKTSAKAEARQGYFGGQQVCGPRHVCCRKPRQQNHINSFGSSQCGVRHSTGINGRIKTPAYVDGDSEFGEYPWQVAILKKDPKESVYVCGGTLIDALHIITAAHCVKTYTNYDLRVRLGEWDVNHDVEFYPYIERDIAAVTVHPEFYAGTLYNDLAILRMDKPVDYNKYPHISPACLPNPRDDYTGTRCWTTGWGKDAFGDFGKYQNILKEVDVPIVGQSQCHRQLQQTRLGYEFKLHPGFICAGGEEGKDACKGDGGGPLVCERSGTMQLVGVVSWGIGCGQYGVPGVYVRVGHYLDWIRQVTQIY